MGVPILYQGSLYKPRPIVPIPLDPADSLRADAIAYWKMDEASGTRMDSSQNNHSLTDTNVNVGSGVGKIGNAAIFNGLTQSLSTDPVLEQIAIGFTVAFWFKLVSPALDQDVTFIIQNSVLDNIEIEFENQGLGVNTIGLYVLGTGYSKELHTCSIGQWNLFVGWYDDSDQQAHVLLNDSASSLYFREGTVVPRSSVGNFLISSLYSDSIGEFLIDEVLLMNRKPTQAECDYLYNSGAGRALFP